MNWKQILSVVASTFFGGFVGFLQLKLVEGIPSTVAQWESIAIGATVAGVIALVHLYQPAPGKAGNENGSKPPSVILGAALFMLVACMFVACKPVLNAVADGVKLVQCIDDHIGEPAPQIIVSCASAGANEATDIVAIIEARKAFARKRQLECSTIIVVDAGAPVGPGR